MSKRRIYILLSFAIMLVISMNLVISTFHSHHHFEWEHPENFADTGNCITKDATVCPICGYLFKTNLPSASISSSTFFKATSYVVEVDFFVPSTFEVVNKGRSPPITG